MMMTECVSLTGGWKYHRRLLGGRAENLSNAFLARKHELRSSPWDKILPYYYGL